MPKKKQVPPLEELSLRAVGNLVGVLGRRLVKPIVYGNLGPGVGLYLLENNIAFISNLLRQNIPLYLYDRMCLKVLRTVQQLIEETKKSYDHHAPMSSFVNEMNVVVSLTEVIISAQLRTIDFTIWPKMMRYVMYKSLHKMTGLEILNLGSCLGSWTNPDKCILEGLSKMTKLTTLSLCFDCNDCIIQILGENCPKLRHLDVTSSRSVTDRCIPSLLKCQYLTELQLNRTSVTIYGYAQLLIGLPYLQDLGRCDEFGKVLKYLKDAHPDSQSRQFNIRKFQSRDVSPEELKLLADMCPQVYHVSVFHDEEINLTILTFLNLTELKLLSCNFYTDCVKQLLKIKGCNLISLHLEHVDEVDLNALMYVSQYCSRLKNLVLYNCDFLNHVSLFANPNHLSIKPFQYLERLFCVADCASLHLEFLFTYCFNIKYIHLGSSTGIDHELMAKILESNPMAQLEELRILYSADLSLRTVDLLLASCPNLKVLSELESWNGISIEELRYFKQYIQRNNFDLDISPTLSH